MSVAQFQKPPNAKFDDANLKVVCGAVVARDIAYGLRTDRRTDGRTGGRTDGRMH